MIRLLPSQHQPALTARGDILGASAAQKHLTGVWRTVTPNAVSNPTGVNGGPMWLISGNEAGTFGATTHTPTTAVPADAVVVVGEGTADGASNEVKAPLVNLRSTEGAVVGQYAWWVGDDGIKAHGTLRDPHVSTPATRPYIFAMPQGSHVKFSPTLADFTPGLNAHSSRPGTKPGSSTLGF